MKNLLYPVIFMHFFLFACGSIALAQKNTPKFTGDFEDILLKDAVQVIENQSNYQFFYQHDWLDSIRVSGKFSEQPLPQVLTDLLEPHRLYYHIINRKIILSQNVPILSQLNPSYFNLKPSSSDSFPKIRFNREIQRQEEDESPQKEIRIEIGTRSPSSAPNTASIAGYVREKSSGEPLTGVVVYVKEPLKTATTDQFGFYSLSLEPGQHILQTQYSGMEDQQKTVQLYSDGNLDWALEDAIISLKEILVESDQDINVVGVQMGKDNIDVKSIKNIPKILGENDILKVALTLPGIQTIGEGASGFNVRGGNSDQNLILLNEATVYNPSHFLGFFSIFNADVIKKTEIYKSSMPVQHGSRLSSIFDVQMRDGNVKKLSMQGGISPVTTRLTIEAPIVKDRTSFILGGRSTYSDWVLDFLPNSSSLRNSQASFYDLVGKLSHKVNQNNMLSLSAYYSSDQFRLNNDSLFSYQNANLSFQWKHNFSNTFSGILTTTYSQYQYQVEKDENPVEAFASGFDIQEYQGKLDFAYISPKHKLDFGVQSKRYQIRPGFIEGLGSESLVVGESVATERAWENALYFADNFDLNARLSLYLGLRYSFFTLLGPKTVYQYTPGSIKSPETVQDSTLFGTNESIINYHGPEIRFAGRYSFNSATSLKLSYNRTRQYLHLLSNTVALAPTDIWKLSDPHIRPQIGDQVSLGLYKNFRNNNWETSVEVYYRWMQNLLDYKTGASLILNPNVETETLQGQGKAYGIEFLIRKKAGKLNGWLSYTYSRTFLQLNSPLIQERINNGDFFPSNYDKPHDLSLVSQYKFTRRYSLAINLAFSSGRPITYPVGRYQFGGEEIIQYSERNKFRIPNYFRLDLGFNLEGNHKKNKLYHSFWTFSIYNITGRENPYSVFFTVEAEEVKGYQLSIFATAIPTITYNFKF